MKATPTPPFIMREPKLLVELLVVPRDAPASRRRADRRAQRRVRRQIAQPVMHGLGLAARPFDHEPLLFTQFTAAPVLMSGTHLQRGEARQLSRVTSVSPTDRPPPAPPQRRSQVLHRDRRVTPSAAQPGGWATSLTLRRLRCLRRHLSRPPCRARLNANAILQLKFSQSLAKRRAIAVGRIAQHDVDRLTGGLCRSNPLERNLWFGGQGDPGRHACLFSTRLVARPRYRANKA